MLYKLSAKQLDDIKIQLKLEVWHAPKPPKLVSTGSKKLITLSIEQNIVDQLALDPTLYLDEVAAYIKEKYALDISLSMISHCLKAKGISKKVLQKRALERNQEVRDY
ncbi:MAG: hypothetical protein M1813_009673 [Trichoglossum hirsutum]|nr:MAG: hypothetical protein M1813_009673 [Trichoglossum hirsutum]